MLEQLHSYTCYVTKFGNKFGSFNLELYSDDPDAYFLKSLYVHEGCRGQGHGNELLAEAELIAERDNKIMFIKVKQQTFLEEWYKRKGYQLYCDDEDEYIWLKKDLRYGTI